MAEYIEREAFVAWIEKQRRLSKLLTIMMLQETPTADVAPVVHGRWIVTKEYNDVIDMDVMKYTCSACGEYRLTATTLSQATNYCPNCGAKMDIE